jgi:site-specific DNA-adenine methylase
MRPFVNFYGGKWRAAPRYPAPMYGTIVEPFAGFAGYSTRYYDHKVVLVEKDPLIASLWAYLIRVSATEIAKLPLIRADQTIDDLHGTCQEAKWLIGFWITGGASGPRKTPTSWMKARPGSGGYWGESVRARIASQVDLIRHWQIIEGSYENAPAIEATHFVDPPYQKAGTHYRESAKKIDFTALAKHCQSLIGQTIVCENAGADWLPFRPFAEIRSNQANAKRAGDAERRSSAEVIWTNDP